MSDRSETEETSDEETPSIPTKDGKETPSFPWTRGSTPGQNVTVIEVDTDTGVDRGKTWIYKSNVLPSLV